MEEFEIGDLVHVKSSSDHCSGHEWYTQGDQYTCHPGNLYIIEDIHKDFKEKNGNINTIVKINGTAFRARSIILEKKNIDIELEEIRKLIYKD